MNVNEARDRLWTEQNCAGLILLVGSSPLPNLLTVLALRPPKDRQIVFVCSDETREVSRLANQIRETLGADAPTFRDNNEVRIGKAYDPKAVFATLRESFAAYGPMVLAYTGGTKVMAAQAHRAWRETAASGDDTSASQRACYVSDASQELIFDSGDRLSLADISLDMEALAKLHGLMAIEKGRTATDSSGPTVEGALEFFHEALRNPHIVGEWLLSANGRGDLVVERPSLTIRESDGVARLRRWRRFVLKNEWLEMAVSDLIATTTKDRPASVTKWNVCGTIPNLTHPFQLDVCHVRGHRVYAVSCTVGGAIPHPKTLMARGLSEEDYETLSRGHTKLKIFEVMERARQIGGDLARSGVICMSSGDTCRELEAEVVRAWRGDEPRACVFGIDHLRDWHAGNLTSLTNWLAD